VVADDGAPADLVEQLRAALRSQLPEYMVPTAFVTLDALPLTPNGKLDRDALPAPERTSPEATYVAPRTPTEEVVAGIWAEVLHLDRVGVHDNFFELGGHSLKLIQIHQRLREALDTDLAVVELFEFPTIAALVKRLQGEVPEKTLLADARDRVAGRATPADEEAIAIVGMAGRFPGAADIPALWSNLRAGVESIRRFTREELLDASFPSRVLDDPDFVPAMGWLADTDKFDAGFFGYSPREAELIDPQHRLFLEYAWSALENAGRAPGEFDGLIGVFGGAGRNTYRENIDSHPDLVASAGLQTVLGGERDFLTTRVSYKLGLGGPSVNVQTACSTSLVAVHMACRSLRGRECDMALAGGVAVAVPAEGGYTYHQDGIGSPDGHCRTFDQSAKGTVAASGVAVVVLRRLSDALGDGDTIHAVIRGTAINNDGSAKVGFTAPGVDGQSRVIAMALADAGVDAETIGYVEAHGTATSLGDPIEVAALTRAYGPRESGKSRCGLGSLKSNLGHLDAAAGVASLIKATLCLSHGELVPSLHFRVPNPEIDFDKGPFFVTTENRAWASPADHPRRAAVSSFGIGGTNAHVILEEAPAPRRTPKPGRPWRVLALSALSKESLRQAAEQLAERLDAQPEVDLDDVAYTLQVGRKSFRHRRVVLARTRKDAVRALTAPGDPHSWSSSTKPDGAKVVFMFPGQGAQYAGMARELYDHEAVFRTTVDEVAEFMSDAIGCHLSEILYPAAGAAASDELTSRTLVTQSALFAVELGLARLWMSWGIKPVACIGHSIGEYVAACVSEAVSLEDALRLVKARGLLMEEAPEGAMLAVALDEKTLARRLGAGLWLSAVNGPASCVVSGVPERVELLETELGAEAVECRRLRTAGAFHSGLMDSVIGPLEDVAREVAIAAPRIPYVSNVTGDWVSASDLEPGYWGRHVREAVRFDDGVARVLESGATVLLEVGPGNTLSALARQRLRANAATDVTVLTSLRHARQEAQDAETVGEALGRLWSAGVAPDWCAYHAGTARRRVPLPTYRFSKDRYWIDRAPAGASAYAAPVQGRGELGNWFHVPTWRQRTPRAPEHGVPAPAPGSWVVLMDAGGVGEEIASTLEARGRHTIRVRVGRVFGKTGARAYELDPRNPQDIGALLDALSGERPGLARVVHAWGIARDATDEDAFERGFYSLLYLLQRVRQTGDDPLGVTVVTNRMYSVCGEEVWRPERAAVMALCRIGPQSVPGLWCSSIDLDSTPARGRAWIQEVVRSIEAPAAQIAAFRGGREFLRAMEPRPLPAIEPGPGRLREGGRYLITGGLGNVGLALARHLAKRVRGKLVLVGRRSAQSVSEGDRVSPNPVPALAAIRELEELGADVLSVRADVSDVAQLREALARADERFGGIDGVIHAAGVVSGESFRALGEITRADLETQFVPKWFGVRALHEALGDRRLDFCLLTSSLSVELGGLQFAAYAAANTIMDQLSEQYRRDDGSRWISVGWDGWDFESGRSESGGGERLGLTPAEAGEAFDRILAAEDVSTVTVCTGDFQARLIGSMPGRSGHGGVDATHERPALDTEFVAPRNEQEQKIAEAWQIVLGLERIGVFDDFFDLGGDSLIAVQLMGRLRAVLGVDVGVQALFDAPTIAALGDQLRKTGKVANHDAAEIASLQDMISRMSDEEVRAALAEDVDVGALDRGPGA